MEAKTLTNLVLIAIAGAIAAYYIWKQKRKDDIYFGKKKEFTTEELLILESYKRKYIPVPKDNRLPNQKKHGYSLEDIAKSATEMIYDHPLPTPEEKSTLKTGDLVKLNFIDKDYETERMWVEIISFENGLFQGELRNDTYDVKELSYGTKIWFHSNHIFEQNKNT